MDLQVLAYIGELVGAIGVVASLIYLSVQIKRNESTTRAATTQELLSKSIDMLLSTPSDSPLLKVTSDEPLSVAEKAQLDLLYFARFSHFNNAHHQNLAGKLDKEIWQMYDARTERNVQQMEGFETWWSIYKVNFTESFRNYIQDIQKRC